MKPVYVLGTGVSHDGSACLLKDGRIAVAIEKERVTRIKHDGGNDTAAIQYCLQAEGITLEDVDLVVQNANFGDFERGNDYYRGPRLFTEDVGVRVVTVSHHLAHAYSAVGMCPFDETAILVIDGCGNGLDECVDLEGLELPVEVEPDLRHLYFEKDSYYVFDEETGLVPVYKDFSPWGLRLKRYPLLPPTTKHSIGGLYAGASSYCFGDVMDLGKLMGLAPYGDPSVYQGEIFEARDGRIFVNYEWMKGFREPARSFEDFKRGFQGYADLASWVQREIERALLYLVRSRYEIVPRRSLAYAGGVALNAVANGRLLREGPYDEIFIVPASNDAGIALGCAYYGWMEVLGRRRVRHDGSTCFGRKYPSSAVAGAVATVGPRKDRGGAPDVGSVDGSGPGELLRIVHDSFRPAEAEGWRGQLDWQIQDAGSFTATIGATGCRLEEHQGPPRSSVVIRTDAETLMAIVERGDDPRPAIEAGKLRCTDMDALLTFHRSIDWRRVRRHLEREGDASGNGSRVAVDPGFIRTTARLLADGKVVGWFQGGSEFGPRALGRRSILADPRKPEIRDLINRTVKHREDFRPFAPVVLAEEARSCFEIDRESPYMLVVAPVREAWRDRIPSVVHLDGSARLQTVQQGWPGAFYDLLVAFREETGTPVLLNTSFNRRGMPIVETPQEALKLFWESDGMDVLVLEQHVLVK